MSYYELSLQWRDPDGTDQYVENVKLYQGDGGSNNANTNDGSTAFTSDDDDLDEDKDNKTSHIARDIRKAID